VLHARARGQPDVGALAGGVAGHVHGAQAGGVGAGPAAGGARRHRRALPDQAALGVGGGLSAGETTAAACVRLATCCVPVPHVSNSGGGGGGGGGGCDTTCGGRLGGWRSAKPARAETTRTRHVACPASYARLRQAACQAWGWVWGCRTSHSNARTAGSRR
jgi:hypothetical protein